MMISIIQGDIIDAGKSHLMWTGLYLAMYGTLVAQKHFMACAWMLEPALAFLPPVVVVCRNTMLSVTLLLWIEFFALLVICSGVEGAVSDEKSICPKPFSYCEGLLIEKDSQTIEAECVLYAGLILEGNCARSHQKDWWHEQGNKGVGDIPQQIGSQKRQLHSF